MNKWLNFGGDLDHGPDPDTDLEPVPDHSTGKTSLGGRMYCPSASSLFIYLFNTLSSGSLVGKWYAKLF